MSAPDDRKPGAPDDSDDEIDRAAILRRRQALLRRAVSSVGAVVLGVMASDCGPEPCLSIVADVPDAGDASDANPQPCLSPPAPDAGPMPCLSDVPAPLDADASDTGSADAGGPDADAEPMPCLSPPLPDEGTDVVTDASDDASPMPCLSPPAPDASADAGPMPCLSMPPPDGF